MREEREIAVFVEHVSLPFLMGVTVPPDAEMRRIMQGNGLHIQCLSAERTFKFVEHVFEFLKWSLAGEEVCLTCW